MSRRNVIQVVLPDDVHASIVAIARLSGTSLSGFVAGILKAEKDTLNQVAQMMQQAREAQDKLSLSNKLSIDQLMMKAELHKDEVLHSLDQVHTIVSDAKNKPDATGGDGRGRRRTGQSDPLAINKGAKNGSEGGKRPVMSRDWQNI